MRERLQKVLSRHGVASRREAERLILQGRISVNGNVVRKLGIQADPETDTVLVDGMPLPSRIPPCVVMLHKPVGYLCTRRKSREHGATIYDLISHDRRLFSIGRLDRDSSGLILLTDDGDLAFRLTHPSHRVKKVYWVSTWPQLSPEQLEKLIKGVDLEDGFACADAVELLPNKMLKIVVVEGRNRLIRRMIRAVGSRVVNLKRTQIGSLKLGSLKIGGYRTLNEREIRQLLE